MKGIGSSLGNEGVAFNIPCITYIYVAVPCGNQRLFRRNNLRFLHGTATYTYLSKAGCIDWLQLLPGTEVKVVVIDGASWKTDTFLVMIIALQPVGDQV